MRKRFTTAILASVFLVGLAAATRAQSTISVNLSTIYHSEGCGPGGGAPFWRTSIAGDPDPAPYTGHVEDIQPASYFEYRINCTTPGLYTVSMVCFEPSDPNTILTFETRPIGLTDDPTVTHYNTPDSKDYGQWGTWGSTGVPRVYANLDPVVAADGTTPLTVPLWQGDNIIRIRNIANRHHGPTAGYPIVGSDLGRTDLRDTSQARWSNLHVAAVTLNRVGDMPAMGTITGTVTGDQPAGQLVSNAIVAANDPGKSPAELASWWNWGYFTYTKSDGTYTLQAPVGSRDVRANRPSSYLPTGSPVRNVTVASGSPVTANLTCPSIWFKDGNGDWNAFPQSEYWDSKNDNLAFQPAPGQNGFRMGWSWAVRKASLIVDVPVSANYEFTSAFTAGDGGTMRLSSSLGPYTEVVQPGGVGWEVPQTVVAPNSIFLAQGTQTLTMGLTTGNCDFDGFQLRQLHTPTTVGLLQGIVTDSLTGNPVAGATVTLAGSSVTTDASGKYRIVGNLGTGQPLTVTAPYQEAGYSGTADVTVADTTKNVALPIRPHIILATSNAYNFKALLNTGDAADYSAASADESAFKAYTVPGTWDGIDATDDIYGWIRVHFTLPSNFLTLIPNRAVKFTITGGGIDDVDKTYLNGTLIGATGKFPDPALSIQPAGHVNPPAGYAYAISWPGLDQAWGVDRIYSFPASLLSAGDNVLAIKCFDLTSGGGLFGTASIEVAPATGAVTGTVKAGGNPVAGARVAVSDANALSSAWGWTDANGAFSLPFAASGAGVLGVTKLGYTAVSTPVMVPANGTITLNVTTTAVAAGANAPMYDTFDSNWAAKWWPVALEDNSNVLNTPTVTQPGYDISQGPTVTIPGTVTVSQLANGHRNSIVSKDRFSRYASVNEAKLVSAKGPAAGSTDDWGMNSIINLHGNAAPDPSVSTPGIFNPEIEMDLEGWRCDANGNNIVQWIVWDTNARRSNGIVPLNLLQMADVTPTNPLTLGINRTGSVYDFYINGTLVHSEYNALSLPDTRVALYGYHILTENTWDYVAAGPIAGSGVKGDINANGLLDFTDVVNALRIAGGLATSTTAQITAGNQAGGDTIINVLDAVRINQALNGKAL